MQIHDLSYITNYLTEGQKKVITSFMLNYNNALKSVGKWLELAEDSSVKAIVLNSSGHSPELMEVHLKYIDIHITLFGTDLLYTCKEGFIDKKSYLPEEDYQLIKAESKECWKIDSGQFAVIKTGIPHSNVLMKDSVKMVIKILEQ